MVNGVVNADGSENLNRLSYASIDTKLSLYSNVPQLLIDVREVVMNDRLVVLFIESKKVAVEAIGGFRRTNPALVKDDLYISKVRASGPSFEDTFSNIHEEVYSPTHDEVDVIGMITLLIDIFTFLNFQGLKQWYNMRYK